MAYSTAASDLSIQTYQTHLPALARTLQAPHQPIAFLSKRRCAWGLGIMPVAGGGATQVTAIAGDLPDWQVQAVDWAR